MKSQTSTVIALSSLLTCGSALAGTTTGYLGWGPIDPTGQHYTIAQGDTLIGVSGMETYDVKPIPGLTLPLPNLPGADALENSARNGAVGMSSQSTLTVAGTIHNDSNGWADHGMAHEHPYGNIGDSKNMYADAVEGENDNQIVVTKTGRIDNVGGYGSEAINLAGSGNTIDNSGVIDSGNFTKSIHNTDGTVNNTA